MQTVENPSNLPRQQLPTPMPVINLTALLGNGFYIMRRMYREPFEAQIHIGTGYHHNEWVKKIAELCGLGYVTLASTGDGFQLTRLGRLVFHNLLERMEHEETLRYERRTKTAHVKNDFDLAYSDRDNRWDDSFEPQPFDLDEF